MITLIENILNKTNKISVINHFISNNVNFFFFTKNNALT